MYFFSICYTGTAIIQTIFDIISEFELGKQLLALTTDNATNIILASYKLATNLDSIFSNTFFQYQRCMVYILNLIVKAGLKFEQNTIKKVQIFIKKIQKSNLYIEDLQHIHETIDIQFLQLVLDIKTQ